jgi:hypothetical protein
VIYSCLCQIISNCNGWQQTHLRSRTLGRHSRADYTDGGYHSDEPSLARGRSGTAPRSIGY